jgi:hypothetical protein
MSRPKGSKNKKKMEPKKSIMVRLSKKELAMLQSINANRTEAVRQMIGWWFHQ